MKKLLWEIYRKINYLPKSICIEACSLCQLKCRDCYMREHTKQQSFPIIGSGYLKFEDYKNFIEKHPYINHAELSFSGEIFLNPNLYNIVEYSYRKNISLTAFNGVNFNNVSDEMLEALVKYQFVGLTISIDGASNETYSIYRQNGNFEKVIKNIQKLNFYKEKYNSKFPILRWQYILFKHNIEEKEQAKKLAKKLNFTGIFYKESWNKETEEKSIYYNLTNDPEIFNIMHKYNCNTCTQIFVSPQVNWDGRLLGCCCSTHRDLDINVFDIGLKKALNSKKAIFMKKVLLGKTPSNDTIACHRCFMYFDMVKNKKFLNKKHIKFLVKEN